MDVAGESPGGLRAKGQLARRLIVGVIGRGGDITRSSWL